MILKPKPRRLGGDATPSGSGAGTGEGPWAAGTARQWRDSKFQIQDSRRPKWGGRGAIQDSRFKIQEDRHRATCPCPRRPYGTPSGLRNAPSPVDSLPRCSAEDMGSDQPLGGGMHSAFSIQHSAFSIQPSAFSLQPSAYCLLPTAYCLPAFPPVPGRRQ
jgi:hypothetical protein